MTQDKVKKGICPACESCLRMQKEKKEKLNNFPEGFYPEKFSSFFSHI
jgi:hypothetical protein